MNPDNVQPDQPPQLTHDQIVAQMQNQINTLQQQIQNSTQAYNQLRATSLGNLRTGKPDKFDGKHVRSWITSIENVFSTLPEQPTEISKVKYAISFMSGEALQWWELMMINQVVINSFEDFKKELLNHFEPINRELNARKMLSELKQMGKFSSVRDYNIEFSKWLLQIPTMAIAEQLFHYSQGLKNRIRIEVERSEATSLQEAMRLADRIDNLFSSGNRSFWGTNSNGIKEGYNGPTPMQIGNINQYKTNSNQYIRKNTLSPSERKRRIEKNLCFVCGKKGCMARNHYKQHHNKHRNNYAKN